MKLMTIELRGIYTVTVLLISPTPNYITATISAASSLIPGAFQ